MATSPAGYAPASQLANAYPGSISIGGTGPNNSATNYNVVMQNGQPGIMVGNTFAPIYAPGSFSSATQSGGADAPDYSTYSFNGPTPSWMTNTGSGTINGDAASGYTQIGYGTNGQGWLVPDSLQGHGAANSSFAGGFLAPVAAFAGAMTGGDLLSGALGASGAAPVTGGLGAGTDGTVSGLFPGTAGTSASGAAPVGGLFDTSLSIPASTPIVPADISSSVSGLYPGATAAIPGTGAADASTFLGSAAGVPGGASGLTGSDILNGLKGVQGIVNGLSKPEATPGAQPMQMGAGLMSGGGSGFHGIAGMVNPAAVMQTWEKQNLGQSNASPLMGMMMNPGLFGGV